MFVEVVPASPGFQGPGEEGRGDIELRCSSRVLSASEGTVQC